MFTKQIFLIASALVAHSTGNCLHGTSLLRRQQAPGGMVKVSTFGYTGLQGPLNWAGLAPANTACSTGKSESPINIDDKIGIAAEALVINLPDVESAEFENLGTTLEVVVNGTMEFAGRGYKLMQFHFHTPSEHRIAQEYFPLEMHMVHEAADNPGEVAVLGITFQLSDDGTTTELLTSVTKNLAQISTPGYVTSTGPLKFSALINFLQTKPLFQYTGSLTTPPCIQGVRWLVTKESLPLDVKTYNALKRVIKFNSRYTQNALNQTNLLQVAAGQFCRRNATVFVGGFPTIATTVVTKVVVESTPAPPAAGTTTIVDEVATSSCSETPTQI